MKLAFSIALRFLKSGKGQTVLIALGIAVGVSVQLFIGSLIQGLQIDLVDTTIGSSSHITITSTSEEKVIDDWERTVYEARLFDPEIIHVSPSVDGPASIDYETDIDPVLVRGFKLEDSDAIYGFSDGLYEGSLPQQRDQAIIGRELAVKSNTSVGDRITLLTPDGGIARLTISGLFDLGVSSLNESWVITSLDTAQRLVGIGNSVTSVEMQVKEVFDADLLADKLEYTISGKNLRIDNWKEQNASLLSGLNGQSVSSYMIQVFVLVAVLLGISSVLAISVVQRSKQLGILKAMGIQDKDASLIFVFQGLMLGILGAIFGIALGFGLLWSFTKFAVNPDGTPVIAIYVNYGFIALSGIFAILSAMIASVIPARLSSRLNPIEVIKNG